MVLIGLMIGEPLERVIEGGSGDWEASVIAGVIRTEVIKVRFKVRLRREGGGRGARGRWRWRWRWWELRRLWWYLRRACILLGEGGSGSCSICSGPEMDGSSVKGDGESIGYREGMAEVWVFVGAKVVEGEAPLEWGRGWGAEGEGRWGRGIGKAGGGDGGVRRAERGWCRTGGGGPVRGGSGGAPARGVDDIVNLGSLIGVGLPWGLERTLGQLLGFARCRVV